MISLHWRGLAKPECADEYAAHLEREAFPALKRLAGFADASILRGTIDGGVEFLVVTDWESLDAIRAFAGDDAEAAVVPPEVAAMMVEFDARARHYEIVG